MGAIISEWVGGIVGIRIHGRPDHQAGGQDFKSEITGYKPAGWMVGSAAGRIRGMGAGGCGRVQGSQYMA
jgi:hypothetical protein